MKIVVYGPDRRTGVLRDGSVVDLSGAFAKYAAEKNGEPHPIAMEMALGFRFTAERFHEIGFLNRLCEPDNLMGSAFAMAEHLLTLPPASRVNTVHMMRQMRPAPSSEQQCLAAALHEHGAKSDLIESRTAFAEKRAPNFKGWDKPEDRYRLPIIDSAKG